MSSGINFISYSNIAMDTASKSTPNASRSVNLVPSPSLPSFFDFDICEEDVWGDDLTPPYLEESSSISIVSQLHVSNGQRRHGSHRIISGLSALLDPAGSHGSLNSPSRTTERFSPVQFSSANMIRELTANGSRIIASSVVSGGQVNTITIINSPSHGSVSKTSQCHGARSAPIKAPVWSKLSSMHEQLESPVEYDEKLPPHEIVARQHAGGQMSSSVMEGAGRTLKGRDMSKVRDAVWQHTGFAG